MEAHAWSCLDLWPGSEDGQRQHKVLAFAPARLFGLTVKLSFAGQLLLALLGLVQTVGYA